MTCYILDDQYGEHIYTGLSKLASDRNFPVQDNILDPLIYMNTILQEQPDYILLDNYFPNRGNGREEPLGDEFLKTLLNNECTTKIICISDYGETLLDKYEYRQEAYQRGKIVDFVSTKNSKDVYISLINH